MQMPIQVSYEGDLDLAMTIMRDAAIHHARVMDDPAPEVHVKGFGESGIDLQLSFWIPDPEEGSASLQSVLYLDIWRAFQAQGVSVPYPQREIRILGTPPQ